MNVAYSMPLSKVGTVTRGIHRATCRNMHILKFTYKHALSEPAEHVEVEVEVEVATKDPTASIPKI